MSKSKVHPTLMPAPAPAGSLVYLSPAHLKTHPKNMRRAYPVDQVRQMGQSIRDYGGLIHPLMVTPDGSPGTYYVVDGNMRLAGARFIGADCPPLKAEIVSMQQAEQMLAMVVANTMRFDVDPISEAQHYRALQAEGLTVGDIAGKTGVGPHRVSRRLQLLDLDEPIQELIAAGRLVADLRVAEALLGIASSELRVKLARRMEGQSVKALLAACAKLQEQLAARKEKEQARTERAYTRAEEPVAPAPLLILAQDRSGLGIPDNDRPAWPTVRAAAAAMCDACDVKTQSLRGRVPEPAWTLIVHVAGETCGNCNVREVAGACQACPGVELLSRLFRSAQAVAPSVGETAPERAF